MEMNGLAEEIDLPTANGIISNHISSPPKQEAVLIEYIKEKDSLKSELKEKDREIVKLKSTVYDLNQKLDETKKKGKTKNRELNSTPCQDSPATPRLDTDKLSVSKTNTTRSRTPTTKRKVIKRKKGKHSKSSSNGGEVILKRADMDRYENVPEVIAHYVEIAEAFPDIKLAVLLESEKFFYESDINNDGTIDEEEMEKMLMKQGYLFTTAELKSIMKEIDIDSNNSIELIEYLSVMVKIQQRKKVNLPQELTKSKLCFIQ